MESTETAENEKERAEAPAESPKEIERSAQQAQRAQLNGEAAGWVPVSIEEAASRNPHGDWVCAACGSPQPFRPSCVACGCQLAVPPPDEAPAAGAESSAVAGGCPDCGRVHPGMGCAPASEVDQVDQVDTDPDEPMEAPDGCGLTHPHGRHTFGTPAELWTCPGVAGKPAGEDLGSYQQMFADYLAEQRHWIGPAQQPLVFHIRKLCVKLDADDDAPASFSSAYLQAISRLDRQRPGSRQPASGPAQPGDQGSIFDELD